MISVESEYRASRQEVASLLEVAAGGLRRGRVSVGARWADVGGELSVDAELTPSTGILRVTVDLGTPGQE